MKYYIQRGASEYGPYTLADLQRYVAQGNILLGDLARSEGMTEWVPVSQVIGNIPIPVPPPAGQGAGGTVYGGSGAYAAAAAPAMVAGLVPPDLHWALVLLITVLTCGLFNSVWLIVEAAWIRKIEPQSRGLMLVILGMASVYGGQLASGVISGLNNSEPNPIVSLVLGFLVLAGGIILLVAAFVMRNDLENYYNGVEPINLQLSGVMTFFFNVYYFQYHFSRIAKWKKTGVLEPQH
jgi:hypothetical protein